MVKNNWYSIIPIKARYNLGTPGKPSYWNRSIHSTPKKGIVVSTHRFCGSRLSRTAPFSALLLFVSVMAARFFSLLIFSSARFCFHGKKEIKRERERSLRLRPICLATEQSAFLTRRRPASRHGADTAVIKILFFPSLSLFSLSLSLSSSRHCNSWLTAASTAAAAAAAAAAVVLFSFILFFSLFPTTRARRRPLIFLFIIISFASPGRAVFFVYLFHCQRPGSMLFSDFVSPLSLSLSLFLHFRLPVAEPGSLRSSGTREHLVRKTATPTRSPIRYTIGYHLCSNRTSCGANGSLQAQAAFLLPLFFSFDIGIISIGFPETPRYSFDWLDIFQNETNFKFNVKVELYQRINDFLEWLDGHRRIDRKTFYAKLLANRSDYIPILLVLMISIALQNVWFTLVSVFKMIFIFNRKARLTKSVMLSAIEISHLPLPLSHKNDTKISFLFHETFWDNLGW